MSFYLDVKCPVCNAEVGQDCVQPEFLKHSSEPGITHFARYDEADRIAALLPPREPTSPPAIHRGKA